MLFFLYLSLGNVYDEFCYSSMSSFIMLTFLVYLELTSTINSLSFCAFPTYAAAWHGVRMCSMATGPSG